MQNQTRGKAEGRKQKAESRRQKAEGRKQKAESRRQKAEGRKQKAVGAASDLTLPSAFCFLPSGRKGGLDFTIAAV